MSAACWECVNSGICFQISWWLWFFFSLYFWIKQTILHVVEIFRPTGLFKNYTISKYWLPITKETFAFYKNVNSGSALLSPHPAPPSPPDPSYQDKSSLLTPPPRAFTWRPSQVSPSLENLSQPVWCPPEPILVINCPFSSMSSFHYVLRFWNWLHLLISILIIITLQIALKTKSKIIDKVNMVDVELLAS